MIALLITGVLLSCSPSKDFQIEPERVLPAISVDANHIIMSRPSNPMGINLNYLRDPDALRPPGAIKKL